MCKGGETKQARPEPLPVGVMGEDGSGSGRVLASLEARRQKRSTCTAKGADDDSVIHQMIS